MSKKYSSIISHYEDCLEKHGDTYKGMDWPNDDDAKKRYQVMLDLVNTNDKVSILDFGCGTSLFLEYIRENGISSIEYHGLDISKKSIDIAQSKFPNTPFYCLDILEGENDLPPFDFVIMNGVFTEKRELEFEEMWEYLQKMIITISKKVDKGIAFNVMSKAVDWERWDLFHLSTDLLIDFLTKEVSRNFVLRNDYGLHEYTVYVYK